MTVLYCSSCCCCFGLLLLLLFLAFRVAYFPCLWFSMVYVHLIDPIDLIVCALNHVVADSGLDFDFGFRFLPCCVLLTYLFGYMLFICLLVSPVI